MAKRFIDSDMFKKRFIRGLPAPYKLLWIYILCECDHSGIWYVDEEVMQVYLGKDCKVSLDEALRKFNEDSLRVIPFDDNKKWFIVPFPNFQYGVLSCGNRAHKSVIEKLKAVEEYDLLSIAYGGSDAKIQEILSSLDKSEGQGEQPDKTQESKEEKRKQREAIAHQVVDMYNEICTSLPSCKHISDSRISSINERVADMGGIDKVKEILMRAEASDFLSGRNNKNWKASFDWIFCCKSNWKKIDEGNYDNNDRTSDSASKATKQREFEFAEHIARKISG